MTEKSAKKTTNKSADPSVLGSLRSTRPTRLGGQRRGSTGRTSQPSAAAAKQAAATKPKAVKPSAATQSVKSGPKASPPTDRQAPSESNGRAGRLTTAVQAAGELAQIGATVAGQLLRRAAGRIPRP